MDMHSKYLGLPLSKNASRSKTLEQVVQKIQQKVQGWKQKILSHSSRTRLIKIIATTTPIYAMSPDPPLNFQKKNMK